MGGSSTLDGKLINEALNILKGCLDNMLNVLRDVIFPTNERLKTQASSIGARLLGIISFKEICKIPKLHKKLSTRMLRV